ncbi:hypothetical protein A2721_02955 [Candidatus Gottesmanbacteria bacterium RIFCSPHIGHO2_01_FULL_47_48]|uniref:Uncharacterized protein n=1 Tax=Candidatus Gottesmanbacteria bacterium RIFCSPHIGHO2_01_FULL_47_48 TaxID=1798381 RepID=A0A1F6A5Q2_9BACT|nr:MAG: hypothetical protein A2721_02955 [Candidatus Gottesmanbacteria bacterium RIFCSPHIGHO2_01_FULL_47_48]
MFVGYYSRPRIATYKPQIQNKHDSPRLPEVNHKAQQKESPKLASTTQRSALIISAIAKVEVAPEMDISTIEPRSPLKR